MMTVVTIGVVASGVMAAVTHLSVSPYAVVRPCRSRGDRSDDCRRTQCQSQDTRENVLGDRQNATKLTILIPL